MSFQGEVAGLAKREAIRRGFGQTVAVREAPSKLITSEYFVMAASIAIAAT